MRQSGAGIGELDLDPVGKANGGYHDLARRWPRSDPAPGGGQGTREKRGEQATDRAPLGGDLQIGRDVECEADWRGSFAAAGGDVDRSGEVGQELVGRDRRAAASRAAPRQREDPHPGGREPGTGGAAWMVRHQRILLSWHPCQP